MKEKIAAMGHHIDVFKTTKGNCYEVYGKDSVGKNIEIYFNPVTGAVFEDVKSAKLCDLSGQGGVGAGSS